MKQDKPPFIEGGGSQTFPQPYKLLDSRFYGFLLNADGAALQALCDRYLNLSKDPNAIYFRPSMNRVVLGVTDMRRVKIGSRDERKFVVPEIDVAFWVPVVAVRQSRRIGMATRFFWFLTYLNVDNAWAVASGREVYGFPKAHSLITCRGTPREETKTPVALETLTVDTLAVEHFGPEARGHVRRLLEVHHEPRRAVSRKDRSLETLGKITRRCFRFGYRGKEGSLCVPGIALTGQLFELLCRRRYPLIFLKQFRDAEDGTKACYRAIVEAPVIITSLLRMGLLMGGYHLQIQELDSHPIASELGLAGLQPPIIKAFYADFNFEMGDGKIIWEQ